MPQEKNDADLFLQTLNWITEKLDQAGIAYMITGGSAVGFWGHIRTTMDIDVVISIQPDQVESFVGSVVDEAYIDEYVAKDAVKNLAMFNVISETTFFKVDLIPLNEEPYEQEKFSRRIPLEYKGNTVYIISPEDLIISKLQWGSSMGGSERQNRDCQSIYELNRDSLDSDYLNKWTGLLGLTEEFNRIASG